jgi:hypothetical protein
VTLTLAEHRRHIGRTIRILVGLEKLYARRHDRDRAGAAHHAMESLWALTKALDRP